MNEKKKKLGSQTTYIISFVKGRAFEMTQNSYPYVEANLIAYNASFRPGVPKTTAFQNDYYSQFYYYIFSFSLAIHFFFFFFVGY